MDKGENELTSGCQKKRRVRETGRQYFLTRLVVHGPQVHFEGADQYTSYQLVVKDLGEMEQ